MKATERLYLTADRSRVVKEGDPAANFLFVTPGKEISAEDMEKYGLTEAPEVKEQQPAENKAEEPAENKAEPQPARRRGAA